MTQEQWLVYLYGVYPGDGTAFILSMWAIGALTALTFTSLIPYEDWDKGIYEKVRKFGKTIWIVGSLIFIGNFVPDKKTFVAIVATPAIVDSYKEQDGKIYKMDLIIDKILDKTVSELTSTAKETVKEATK